jgi:hypothetical protein
MGYMSTGAGRQSAERALTRWAAQRREVDETRDQLILGAVGAGISKHRIYVLTGIARSTIDSVIARKEASGGAQDQ